MKKAIVLLMITGLFSAFTACAQRPSPAAKVSETTTAGVKITIDYSQPAVKGRTIGKDIAPFGKVWRTGANEATWMEVSKDVKVEGKALKAGKYGIWTIPGEKEWTIIFNSKSNISGTEYNQASDVMRVVVKPGKSASFSERMTFKIAKTGVVSLIWGDHQVNFNVK
ncbi:Protein of unknown function [Daejeonella rubra]|uniref:DUF2911 domain-containing protein n=1 Tax=Daejeonella rubra TaxID=990371 RepID=A0A1G9X1C1_9SPHI|nr:DUF2911 domain-containing protein [Daejeonella rubra]SDM90488.1 Protein of unknown function [Daejeonella rubra]